MTHSPAAPSAPAPPETTAVALHTEFSIKGQPFSAAFKAESGDITLAAGWHSRPGGAGAHFSLRDLTEHFAIALPASMDWRFTLEEARILFRLRSKSLAFALTFREYPALTLESSREESGRAYSLRLTLDSFFPFAGIPVLGRLAGATDGVGLEFFKASFVPARSLALSATGRLALGGGEKTFDVSFAKDLTKKNKRGEANADDGNPVSGIRWFEVNKSFRALRIDRIGLLLQGSSVTVFLDAGFSLSVLRMDFHGLFLSVPLAKEGEFDYGLQGLMIAFDKPPLAVSGGLYKVPGELLFNGKASVRFGAFSLAALGSYGEMKTGETTFFLYLMLSYPLGGPPCFFITGLAAGFGINRKLRLPELKDVPRFPFVAAALQRGGGLAPGTKPADALNVLSDWVQPSTGDYFVTAGIAFTSFNLVDCFVLLSVAFGNTLQISLLGTASLSLPPKLPPEKNPIAYAGLALRALYDQEKGSVDIRAALTAESYIFDKRCKLTGGFAFCMWSKGEYAGDFVITLGGCRHPNFRNKHYPAVDKLGINWQISSNLSLKGGAYFAAMPSGLMAGGDLEIAYTSGSLKAWLRLLAEFYLQWKPFAYDITVSVSLGASYTCKIFGIRVTLKVELGASLHIWGPEFSGKLTIKLFIFSITIGFGGGKADHTPIGWDEFDKSFLPKNPAGAAKTVNRTDAGDSAPWLSHSAAGRRLCAVAVEDGIIAEDKAARLVIVSALRLSIATRSDMPVTSLFLNGENVHRHAGALGVAPMGKTDYTAEQRVTVVTDTGKHVAKESLRSAPVLGNVSPALWKNSRPDINDGALPDVPSGLSLRFAEKEPAVALPPDGGAYDLDALTERECVFAASFDWDKTRRPVNTVPPGTDVHDALRGTFRKNSVRDGWMRALQKTTGCTGAFSVRGMADRPEDYFLARPVCVATAAAGHAGSGGNAAKGAFA